MATLDYIDVPSCATQLEDAESIHPAHKITTSLPQPDPADDYYGRHQRSNSSAPPGGIAAASMSFIPQILMGSIPTVPVTGPAPPSTKKCEPEKVTLLSCRDPLSLPIITNNFKRFVARVGPVFWLQDRIEEILFWKRGWRRTASWMALYAFLCYFPRMVLLIPHALLIGVILSSYPYTSYSDLSTVDADLPSTPTQAPLEGTAAWQANLQGIQNLMGFVADMTTVAEPYTYHLSLTPQHLTPSTSNISAHVSPTTRSPYTPHILTLLVVTFFPILILIHLPNFPIREVALIGGLTPFLLTHPTTLAVLPSLLQYSQKHIPILVTRYEHVLTRLDPALTAWMKMPLKTMIERLIDNDRLPDEIWHAETREVELFENERYESTAPVTESTGQGWSKANLRLGERSAWTRGRDGWTGIGPEDEIRSVLLPIVPLLSPLISDDRIHSIRSYYRPHHYYTAPTTTTPHSPSALVFVWVSDHCRLFTSIFSSNLTFSLSPNWRFVPTEDWRRDLTGDWAECGGGGTSEDGWVYSNDAWLGPRLRPYNAGGGSVTRRRRWVRRIWYDANGIGTSITAGGV